MQGPDSKGARRVAKALLRGFFANERCYSDMVGCALPHLFELLMSSELPLDGTALQYLAWQEHVLAIALSDKAQALQDQALTRQARGVRPPSSKEFSEIQQHQLHSRMCVKHATMQRLAAGSSNFMGGSIAALAQGWLREAFTQRGAPDDSDEDDSTECTSCWDGDRRVFETWEERTNAVCNADSGLASLGHIQGVLFPQSLLELCLADTASRHGDKRKNSCRDVVLAGVPDMLKLVCGLRQKGPMGVNWQLMQGSLQRGEVVDDEDWPRCWELDQASHLTWDELQICLLAVQHATAVVHTVPA
jgi:hypothetical protein